MHDASIVYDNINKRLVVVIGDEQMSIPVHLTGTWHAAVSIAEIKAKTAGQIRVEDCVAALKKYRSRNRKSLTVSVEP
jgi:hypothetical protein